MSDKTPKIFEQLNSFQYRSASTELPFSFWMSAAGKIFEWNARMDAPARALRKMTRAVNTIVDGVVLLCLGVALAMFVVTTFVLLPVETWSRAEFWAAPSAGRASGAPSRRRSPRAA